MRQMTIEQYRELEYIISLIDLERDEIAERRAEHPKDKGVRGRG